MNQAKKNQKTSICTDHEKCKPGCNSRTSTPRLMDTIAICFKANADSDDRCREANTKIHTPHISIHKPEIKAEKILRSSCKEIADLKRAGTFSVCFFVHQALLEWGSTGCIFFPVRIDLQRHF